MQRIINSRGTGKTSLLMLLAKENNAIFVCESPAAMEDKAHRYGIVGIQFMSYKEFLNHGGLDTPYVIDELELFTKYMIETNHIYSTMLGYTMSNED